jgi:dUTP pyrophosphatase
MKTQEIIKVKIKKLEEKTITPNYTNKGDAGLDFYAANVRYVYGDEDDHHYSLDRLKYIEYGTNIALEIPPGFVGLMFPRSSITNKHLILGNAVGVIDSSYRGEIKFRFKRTKAFNVDEYKVGDKIGQLIIMAVPQIELEESHELSDTLRSSGGYGSTGA